MKFKKATFVVSAFAALSLILSGCGSDKSTGTQTGTTKYPQKTIKIVSTLPEMAPPSQIAKMLAGIIEKQKHWKFEFAYGPENGGDGAVKQVWNAPHDGYTVLSQTETILGNGVLGFSNLTTKDWVNYEMYSEPIVILVTPDSPYKSIEQLIEAAKKNPGSVKIEYPGRNSAFYFKMKVLEKVTGAKFDLIEDLSGMKTMGDLYSKKYDAIVIPLVIGIKDIGEGKVIPLAMVDEGAHDFGGAIGRVETVAKLYPEFKKYLPLDAMHGLALPKDTPKDVVEAFGKAFDDAVNSPEFDGMLKSHDSLKVDFWGDDAKDFMAKFESNYAWLMKELGLGNVDPETLRIQKPQWMK